MTDQQQDAEFADFVERLHFTSNPKIKESKFAKLCDSLVSSPSGVTKKISEILKTSSPTSSTTAATSAVAASTQVISNSLLPYSYSTNSEFEKEFKSVLRQNEQEQSSSFSTSVSSASWLKSWGSKPQQPPQAAPTSLLAASSGTTSKKKAKLKPWEKKQQKMKQCQDMSTVVVVCHINQLPSDLLVNVMEFLLPLPKTPSSIGRFTRRSQNIMYTCKLWYHLVVHFFYHKVESISLDHTSHPRDLFTMARHGADAIRCITLTSPTPEFIEAITTKELLDSHNRAVQRLSGESPSKIQLRHVLKLVTTIRLPKLRSIQLGVVSRNTISLYDLSKLVYYSEQKQLEHLKMQYLFLKSIEGDNVVLDRMVTAYQGEQQRLSVLFVQLDLLPSFYHCVLLSSSSEGGGNSEEFVNGCSMRTEIPSDFVYYESLLSAMTRRGGKKIYKQSESYDWSEEFLIRTESSTWDEYQELLMMSQSASSSATSTAVNQTVVDSLQPFPYAKNSDFSKEFNAMMETAAAASSRKLKPWQAKKSKMQQQLITTVVTNSISCRSQDVKRQPSGDFLPPEILVKVFECLLPPTDSPERATIFAGNCHLRYTCRLWREIVAHHFTERWLTFISVDAATDPVVLYKLAVCGAAVVRSIEHQSPIPEYKNIRVGGDVPMDGYFGTTKLMIGSLRTIIQMRHILHLLYTVPLPALKTLRLNFISDCALSLYDLSKLVYYMERKPLHRMKLQYIAPDCDFYQTKRLFVKYLQLDLHAKSSPVRPRYILSLLSNCDQCSSGSLLPPTIPREFMHFEPLLMALLNRDAIVDPSKLQMPNYPSQMTVPQEHNKECEQRIRQACTALFTKHLRNTSKRQ